MRGKVPLSLAQSNDRTHKLYSVPNQWSAVKRMSEGKLAEQWYLAVLVSFVTTYVKQSSND